ncbi:MAG TPA: methyltransferase domain-containing protein [Streptosporangiaceae bacterium]
MADEQQAGLLGDSDLERSAVVANCLMNRERQLAGVNSYERELGFNPLPFLRSRLAEQPPSAVVRWLDLCCGTGRALVQAAGQLAGAGFAGRAVLVGVDLAGMFDPVPASAAGVLRLVTASVTAWEPGQVFDLITCVHGLHYVGDKLAVLTRTTTWLAPDGLLIADLDLDSIRTDDGGQAAARSLARRLRACGYSYSARRHQIRRSGPAVVSLPYIYLGADDRAGPGYTGQPAVSSYYRTDDQIPEQAAGPSEVLYRRS